MGGVDPASVSLTVPSICDSTGSAILVSADNRWIREEAYRCAQQYSGELTVGVQGLNLVGASAAVRLIDLKKNERVFLLPEDSDALSVSPENDGRNSAIQYLVLGWQHIFEGIDHILFVIALCFLGRGSIRALIALITAFTVAHSVTLSAASLGWVSLPARPVEALIAFSIALVAADLLRNLDLLRPRVITYWPVVFVFGLLHGLGFAGALEEIGLPETARLPALLSFNVGVELGQISLVLATVMIIKVAARWRSPAWLNAPVGLCIGCTAGFWFISRIV